MFARFTASGDLPPRAQRAYTVRLVGVCDARHISLAVCLGPQGRQRLDGDDAVRTFEDLFSCVPDLAAQTDPVLIQLDHLLDNHCRISGSVVTWRNAPS